MNQSLDWPTTLHKKGLNAEPHFDWTLCAFFFSIKKGFLPKNYNFKTMKIGLCVCNRKTWKIIRPQIYLFKAFHHPVGPTNWGQMPVWIGNPFQLILWIKEFLWNQLWHVKWNGCLSNEPVLNTSVPLGRAISFFYIVYLYRWDYVQQ